jgi:hypothetical protein
LKKEAGADGRRQEEAFFISHLSFLIGHFSDLISWCFVDSFAWLRDERTTHEITRTWTNKKSTIRESQMKNEKWKMFLPAYCRLLLPPGLTSLL